MLAGLKSGALVLIALYAAAQVSAHIALWDESMYGYDPNDPNQSEPVTPLADLPFSEWWFHGYINRPPAPGKFMNLPAGGTYHGQVACNKALTRLGRVPAQQTGIYACDGDDPNEGGIGAMHSADKWRTPVDQVKDVKGCGIAIAYKSDPFALVPEDFTVISTNYTCPWFKNVDFQIPADLPACPPGGCHCMWGWLHSIYAGSQQNYVLNYRCNVTGAAIGAQPIPPPKPAKRCAYPGDTRNCTVGPKQPHYWYQLERNNNDQHRMDPPFYNQEYGFANGAQTDLFAGVAAAPTTTPTAHTSTTTTSASTPTTPVAVPTIPTTGVTTSSSTTPSLSPTTTAAQNCKRKRSRALDRYANASPAELERHRVRNERRRQRLLGQMRRMYTQVPSP